MANPVPLPVTDPVAIPPVDFHPQKGDQSAYRMNDKWVKYFTNLEQSVSIAPARLQHVGLTTQGAAIVATPLNLGVLSAGTYRISYYMRVTRAASVSSSLTFTLSWTDLTVACTQSGAALTGNTVTTEQNGVFTIDSDGNSAINYAIAYASVGGTSMQYKLTALLEAVSL